MADEQTKLANVVVLIVLLAALLVVATRFRWMHCSVIPGWCDAYYQLFPVKIAIVTGDGGIGDAQMLKSMIYKNTRYYPIVYSTKQASLGVLDQFGVVIVEGAKEMSDDELMMFATLAAKGKILIWIGDSGTVDENGATVGWKRKGVDFSAILMADYLQTTDGNFRVNIVDKTHPLTEGMISFDVNGPYTLVKPKYANITMPATLNEEYPAIIERRWSSLVFYYAFPPEEASKVLVTNMIRHAIE